MKKKKFSGKLPFPTTNQRLQELQMKIDRSRKELETISKSYDTQIALLGSFASHDLKNYIHSIDGIVSTRESHEITDDDLESIRENIVLMRKTLKDFAKLVQHDDKGCSLIELIEAVTILNRSSFAENHIEFIFKEPNEHINFKIPFVSMLQLINNLVINAIKALKDVQNKKIHLHTTINDNTLTLSLLDNGIKIPTDIQTKIFDYGFSASGGSGIGLFHAQYLCQMYNGSICYHENQDEKGFIITLPIIKDNP